MKIWTLIENTACREDLAAEHGLSLYIEACGRRILFDSGQSDAFADNAAHMGIDLRRVDFAVLSHGHYDHGGGMGRFLKINPTAPIYLTREALDPHYHGVKYIGLSPVLSASRRLRWTADAMELAPGITLYRNLTCTHPVDSAGLQMVEKGRKKAEDFRHEQYLLIEEGGRRVLFSGCSHRGIENIAEHFRPDVLIGGFHFSKLPPDSPRLRAAAQALLSLDCRYYTCHCTGQAPFDVMKTVMGGRLEMLRTGSVLELS